LNTLIARKGISWSRLFADLEQVLPYNARLIALRPQANARNEIQLEMTIGAQSMEPVIDLLKRMEASPVFSIPSVATMLPPSQSEPLYRYRVSVNYAQKL
jgi:type IV pilus assembly protein PilN